VSVRAAASGQAAPFDERTTSILNRIQAHIPLVPRPYEAVARDLGLDEAEVIACVAEQRAAKVVRQISAIFDTRSLGYQSTLVAASYDPARLDEAAAAISAHPGVSHNYSRNHDFNLWYTIAVPPGRSLEEEVGILHRVSGALSTRILPALQVYKIGVNFAVGGAAAQGEDDDPAPKVGAGAAPALPLTDEIRRTVRALQKDIPAVSRPFSEAAAAEGFASEEQLLAIGERLRRKGAMRRFSAVLRHRKVGFGANGMAAWVATPEQCDALGPRMAASASVSHCYQRPAYEDWPYRLFTMIHGRSTEDVEAVVEQLREATGLGECRVLYSDREYKKTRLRYFTDEWDCWDWAAGERSTGGGRS
jgi:DNA-binding Lrp family transcriptional regulator